MLLADYFVPKGYFMKKINIITSLSPQKQYALRRWFYISVVLSLVLVSLGIYFIIPPFLVYVSLQKDIQVMQNSMGNYTASIASKESLKKEYNEWHMRQKKVNCYKQQLKNPYEHIAYILAQCKDNVHLESMRFNKKNVEVIVRCETSGQANMYAKQLNESKLFSQVKIISLQYDDAKKQLLCSITAYVIF